MGAFMYFGLVLTTVLFLGGPLVLFRLMLETVAARATAAEALSPSSDRSVTSVRYERPSLSSSAPVCA